MPRLTPHVISARVDATTLARLHAVANRLKSTLSHVVCLAVDAVASGKPDPAGTLAKVAECLGLPGATPAEILAVIQDAMESVDPAAPPTDPLTADPEAPPVKMSADQAKRWAGIKALRAREAATRTNRKHQK